MANAPMPTVSVMALSPISGLASSSEKPFRYKPLIFCAGATYQRSPKPLTRMPKSVPLRAIVVTIVLKGISCAASAMALQAAIEIFR